MYAFKVTDYNSEVRKSIFKMPDLKWLNFYIYKKKSNLQKNTEKNICESITYEDNLVEFLWFYTQYFTRNRILIKKITFLRL